MLWWKSSLIPDRDTEAFHMVESISYQKTGQWMHFFCDKEDHTQVHKEKG